VRTRRTIQTGSASWNGRPIITSSERRVHNEQALESVRHIRRGGQTNQVNNFINQVGICQALPTLPAQADRHPIRGTKSPPNTLPIF
jgi:hypothetical protein